MRPARDYAYFDAPPLAFAHRGGALYEPNLHRENTLVAFRNAVELGYRYIETDVHATSDGVLVAFHDKELDRVTDGRGAISGLPYAQVREARIAGQEPIPLLAEILEALPATRVNIDIKASGAIGPLWRAIEEHSAHDRVCVASFSNLRLARFRRLARGRVATAAGWAGTAALRFGPAALTAVVSSPGQVLQIPDRMPLAGRPVEVVTPRLIETAHRVGKQVHVWTIDDPGDMTRLLDMGADGIVSDRIEVLRRVLEARGQWA
ncbi:MAG TPA: glycerophosphodiester phosphodiesterase [Candidatus Lustribacter sp.]|nr:glycerophosphodiester phosphodiesterase [Candidatus Lustribacter sp.]